MSAFSNSICTFIDQLYFSLLNIIFRANSWQLPADGITFLQVQAVEVIAEEYSIILTAFVTQSVYFLPPSCTPIHYSLHFIQQSDESVELLNDLCRSTPFKIPMFTNLYLVWLRVIYLTDGELKSKVICYRIWLFHSPKYFTTSLERLGKRWYNRTKKWYEENIFFLQE